MAGTIGDPVVTISGFANRRIQSSRRLLTTHASTGDVSGVAVTLPACRIKEMKFIPNLAGTQPTNLFDATLLDSDGLDLLGGGGANLLNTGPTLIQLDVEFRGGVLYPTIVNAGNSKTITLVITVEV